MDVRRNGNESVAGDLQKQSLGGCTVDMSNAIGGGVSFRRAIRCFRNTMEKWHNRQLERIYFGNPLENPEIDEKLLLVLIVTGCDIEHPRV